MAILYMYEWLINVFYSSLWLMKPHEERTLLCKLKSSLAVMPSLPRELKYKVKRLIRKIEVRQVNDVC